MPSQIPALDAVGPAFHHTWSQLFKPFRLGLWARLALVGIATGEIPGCGGGGGDGTGSGEGDQFLSLPTDPIALFLLIFLGVLLGFVLVVGLIYVASVFRFVLLDIVLTDRHKLIKGWWRWQKRGFSYFLWQLVFAATLIVTLVIVVGVPAFLAGLSSVFEGSRPSLPVVILLGMWLGFSLMAVVVAGLVVYTLARDFVVPIMALEEVGAVEGWSRFLPMLLADKLNYLVYMIARIVLVMASLIFFGIPALILVIVLWLFLGGVGLTLFLTGLWAEWTWNFYTIGAAILFGGAALLITMYLVAFLCTPVVAFFPTYALHFLGLRYARVAEALNRHPLLVQARGASPEPGVGHSAGRRTQGTSRDSVRENGPFTRQAIQIRCPQVGVSPVGIHQIGPELVDHYEDHVGWSALWTPARDQGEEQNDDQPEPGPHASVLLFAMPRMSTVIPGTWNELVERRLSWRAKLP